MSSNQQDHSVLLKDAPQAHRVQRDGERDLSFQGWRLAHACVERGRQVGPYGDRERKTCVSIFVTLGAKLVVEVRRAQNTASDLTGAVSAEIDVESLVTESPDEILAFLKSSNRGAFGQASREAWNMACETFPPLAPYATEHID